MLKSFVKSLTNLFRAPATSNYPAQPTFKPDTYRGLIQQDPEKCISCRRCEQVCPPGAITFSQETDGAQTYHYSPYVCIYCGECVRICPKEGALVQSAEPAKPAVAADNPSSGWDALVQKAKESREAFAAAKKKAAAAAKAKAAEAKPAEASAAEAKPAE